MEGNVYMRLDQALRKAGILPGDYVLFNGGSDADDMLFHTVRELGAISMVIARGKDYSGADLILPESMEAMSAAVASFTGGMGPNAVIDPTGSSVLISWAIGALSPTGTLLFSAKEPCLIHYNASDIVRKELNVLSIRSTAEEEG